MFANNLKLDGIENILGDIGYMEEMKGAGEDQEHKYKKSGKKSKDYDGDGTVEDESDEYAGVKDRAIKKAIGKCSKCSKEPCECEDTKKESVDFSSVLDELTDEDLLFLSDTLIEEVVEEFFYETLEEGFEVDELETLLIEQVESELTYLEEAKVTVGHDSDVKPEENRTSKLSRVKDAVKKVASGAKKVAKKVAGAAGEVAGAAVAGYRKATANSSDSSGDDSTKDSTSSGTRSSGGSSSTGTRSSGGSSSTGTNRPGILGRIASGLKSGLKKAIHGAGKIAGKVVKTAKAGYDEGRGKETKSAPAAKPAATASAKPAAKKPTSKPAANTATANTATAKKKSGGNLDNLLKQIRSESKMSAPETAEKERIVRGMKKSTGEFMNRYPDRWQNVMYATATKLAKEEMELDEAGKLQGGGKDPCWKGYEMVGMKNKSGKEVPNCVPKEEYEELVMDMIQEGYDMDQVREIIGALEDGYEVIFEENGAVINDEVEQLDEEVLDEQFLSDVEAVADWLHTEGIIENEDEFFELMEDLDEEEIEELYTIVKEELKPLPKEKMARQSKKAYDAETAAAASGDEKETNKQMQRRIAMQNPAGRRTALQNKNEEYDVFKTVLEFLCVEGYAETLEEAEWLMANVIDEEAIEIIVGKEQLDELSVNKMHDYINKAEKDRDRLNKKWDQGTATPKERKKVFDREEGEARASKKIKQKTGKDSFRLNALDKLKSAVTKEEYMDEAQEARNNPEKYEREQSKKYAPVRGEKTPMPPRGNKRREDFEKWYAANVR